MRMLSTSFEFRNKMAQSSNALLKATLTLADGTVENLVGDDFMLGTAGFSEAVSSNGSFDIGAAIIGQFEVDLNNFDHRFDEYDFTDSTIEPYIGVELDAIDEETGEHEVEWLAKGIFNVEPPESYGGTIGITALDNMCKFEKPYSGVTTTYSADLGTIAEDICTHCGVALKDQGFANHGYVVGHRPDDSLTCIQVIAFVAQASGNFAKCDTRGRLVIDWYDTAAFEGEDWLDGETFDDDTPYSSGDDADGGTFSDYTSGDSYDGGAFTGNDWLHLFAYSNLTVATDDVVITGVRVTASDEQGSDGTAGSAGETALSGTEGYVLDITGNKLVQYGQASTVAAQIAARVVGMRFRPFEMSGLGVPYAEAGDCVIVTDRNQNQYRSYLTSFGYKLGRYASYACRAETPSRNKASSYAAATSAIVNLRNRLRAEHTAREIAQAILAQQLAGAAGFYQTDTVQQDGSAVRFLHDKPTLAQSQTIWKITADAFGVSTNGGASYTYGVDSNGVAILNQIYATGIDADYLVTGTIESQNGEIAIDLDQGTMTVNSGENVVTSAFVREKDGGLLMCKQGNPVGALVNANGSFDVVNVTWSNGVPTIGSVITSFGESVSIGHSTSFGITIAQRYIAFYLEAEQALRVAYTPPTTTGGTDWKMDFDFMLGTLFARVSGGNKTLSSNSCPLLMKDDDKIKYWDGHSDPAQMTSATFGTRGTGTVAGKTLSVGSNNVLTNGCCAAVGEGLVSANGDQFLCGLPNVSNSSALLIVGNGEYMEGQVISRSNAFLVYESGNAWLSGSLSQNSDRRLKEHLSYLGGDACDFVRKLKPALYLRKGVKHVGFYAQDVQDADEWGTAIVASGMTDESLGFETLSLDYTALIAPLTAYAQSLEERVAQLEERLARLEAAVGE